MTTTFNLNAATALVSTFHNTLTAHNTAHKSANTDFQTNNRERLYKMLGEAYAVSLQLNQDQAVLGQLCAKMGVSPPSKDENPHGAPIRMMFRKKKGAGFEPDRSAWKYTKTFRAAEALGWTGADFADSLAAFSYVATKDGKEKTLRGLIAAETYDTDKHGSPETKFSEEEAKAAVTWMLRTQEPKASFQASLLEQPKPGQLVGLVAQYDAASDSYLVRAVSQADHDRAWSSIAKPTIAAFKEWRNDAALRLAAERLDAEAPEKLDELLAALDTHRSDVERAEAESAMSRRLTVFETDGLFAWPTENAVGAVTSSDDAANDTAAA